MLFVDVVLLSNLFPLQHSVQRRWAILGTLFRRLEGFYFGPHDLIMASLIHFEEKVHRKKLQRVDTIPLPFSRLLCKILEYLGFPIEPRLERHHLFQEWFTLDKWNQLAGYSAHLGAPPMVAPPVPSQPEHARAPGRDHTTSAHTWGYFCFSAYYSYYSISRADYIWAVHYHIGFGVSCPSAYLLDTHHHPFCSLSEDGWDACSSGPIDCYSPLDSAALETTTSASAWPSHILSAYSSNWGHYTNRGLDSTTSGWAFHSHSYARGGIISTWGSHHLIIGHLFILLYLHVI